MTSRQFSVETPDGTRYGLHFDNGEAVVLHGHGNTVCMGPASPSLDAALATVGASGPVTYVETPKAPR